MRRAFLLALLALALPIAAWADIIETNRDGSISVSTAGIVVGASQYSQLMTWDGFSAAPHGNLGHVTFATGSLATGLLMTGGTFNGGGFFKVTGLGAWVRTATGGICGTGCSLFSGSFVGPVTLTLISLPSSLSKVFTLSGHIQGTLFDGRTVSGTTTQTLFSTNAQWTNGIGHIRGGNMTTLPEPGTLSLLGTGLVGIAGMFRRKLIGA